MNQIIGHDEIAGQRFPRFSGPCQGCGAINYGLSTSGPEFCGACACGIPPEVSKLRRELMDLQTRHLDALLALSIATGHKVGGLTDKMRKRGDAFLDKFKSEPPFDDADITT